MKMNTPAMRKTPMKSPITPSVAAKIRVAASKAK